MTVIDTAPQRLALMLMDADERIRNAFYTERDGVDQAERYAWVIRDGDNSDYMGASGAQAAHNFTETYDCELYGPYFGMGAGGEHELEMRAIVKNTIEYFAACPRLQFQNLRSLQPAPLGPLQRVLWISLRREHAGKYLPPSHDESQMAWGFILHVTIVGKMGIPEVLIG